MDQVSLFRPLGWVRFLFLIVISVLFLAGCGPGKQKIPPENMSEGAEEAIPPPEPAEFPELPDPVPPADQAALVAPLWEKAKPTAGQYWTEHAYRVVDTLAPSLLNGTKDVTSFCPAFASLSRAQKISFWVYFISAVTKYESGFDPTSRMRETGMGIDPITGSQVFSEGLLQLSYQDVRSHPFCNEFDWKKDKLLAANDPRKTILDPNKNLSCGIRILDKLAGKKNLVAYDQGHYWAVLKPAGKYGQVKNIQKLTQQIAFCRK